VSLVTVIRDIGWFLLIVLLLPLWLMMGLAALAFVVARHLYWWARDDTTGVSRHEGRLRSSWAPWSRWTGGPRPSQSGVIASNQRSTAPVLATTPGTAPVADR